MKNPVIPFGVIAAVGILTIIIVSYIGVVQRDDILAEEAGGGEPEQAVEGEVAAEPDAMYEANCTSCHGADLSGGMGPELTAVGSNFTADEVSDIIQNGTGSMPAMNLSPEESDILAEWLVEETQ